MPWLRIGGVWRPLDVVEVTASKEQLVIQDRNAGSFQIPVADDPVDVATGDSTAAHHAATELVRLLARGEPLVDVDALARDARKKPA